MNESAKRATLVGKWVVDFVVIVTAAPTSRPRSLEENVQPGQYINFAGLFFGTGIAHQHAQTVCENLVESRKGARPGPTGSRWFPFAESARGISPRAAHRTGRKPVHGELPIWPEYSGFLRC